MITNTLGLTLNVFTVGITSLWLSIAIISVLTPIGLQFFNSFNAGRRAGLLWSVVLLPCLVAVASIFFLLAPEILQFQIDWLSSLAHWHHAYVFHIVSWHGAVLLIFSAIFLVVLMTRLNGAIKTSAQLRQLDYFVNTEELNDITLLIDSDSPQAFTAGLFYPRSYITRGLRSRLSENGFAVVQQHELAHQRRRDPLQKYVFSLLASFYPKRVGQKLNEAFSLALEQLADQSALNEVQDRALVSRTILEVARLSKGDIDSSGAAAKNCGFTSNALQLRIRYLLDGESMKPFPLFGLLSCSLMMVMICTMSVDLLHHSIETLFSH